MASSFTCVLDKLSLHIIIFTMHILDVNECSQQNTTHECHSNASYQNTDGSYTCYYNAGYQGNGFNCSGKILMQRTGNLLIINSFRH